MRGETPSTLAATTTGVGPVVTLLHGFAQNRSCLGPLAEMLGSTSHLVLPDAPGHGGSAAHADADVPRGAQLLVATGRTGAYVGYSMGGRLCLQAAVDHPDAVRALVLIGATPGIEDPRERRERHTHDVALADRLEHVGLDEFLAEWLDLPMFVGLPDWARFDVERRTNSAAGLAASLRNAGTGAMAPLWDRLGGVSIPVLWLTGSDDDRYGDIARRAVDRIGACAQHRVVEGAGHAAHLERPELVGELISAFIAGLDR